MMTMKQEAAASQPKLSSTEPSLMLSTKMVTPIDAVVDVAADVAVVAPASNATEMWYWNQRKESIWTAKEAACQRKSCWGNEGMDK